MIIEVNSNKVTVYIDHKTLRSAGSDLSTDRNPIDISNTETKLFRQEDGRYSIEMDIERFVILTDQSLTYEPTFSSSFGLKVTDISDLMITYLFHFKRKYF